LGLKSIACLPLLFRGSVLGVLYLDSRGIRTPFRAGQMEVLTAFADHAATAIEHARLYEVAIVDPLTGGYRRHHFEQRLGQEFERAERHRSPLALLFMDIDHFKKVNDGYGHPVGDEVLQEVSRVLKATARNTDVAARWGGEEFVLLAPETAIEAAVAMAEPLRTAA